MDVDREDEVTELGDPLVGRAAVAQPIGRDTPSIDLDALYREHCVRFVRLATAITLDRSVAEEVVHDAFASLHRHGNRIDNPVGYLQRSVVNHSISVIRRRRTAARYPMPRPAITVNPEIDETWAAVSALPARERAVVVLRYWLDLSEADMASSLGWPAGTVKSTLNRALKRLKKELPK